MGVTLEAGITCLCPVTGGVAPNEASRGVERSWGDMGRTRGTWAVRDKVYNLRGWSWVKGPWRRRTDRQKEPEGLHGVLRARTNTC